MLAKCQNFSGCLLAYRQEDIEVAPNAPMQCPECGKELVVPKPRRVGWVGNALALGAAMAIGGLAVYLIVKPSSVPTLAPTLPEREPAAAPLLNTNPLPAPVDPSQVPDSAGVPVEVEAPAKIDLDLHRAETQAIKTEVLTRIDLMPTVSATNKDKLYASVDRARRMGKVLTVSFGQGRSAIGAADFKKLRENLEAEEINKLRSDPTCVFVILGYADPKGDKTKNLAISQARADSVLAAMRDRLAIVNVMHAVAMGSSTLQDSKNLEKNRIVEIWAVLP